MSEIMPSAEEYEPKAPISELLSQYMAGDSHEHTIASNPNYRHEADYGFKEISEYLTDIENTGSKQIEFIAFTDHSTDTGDPHPTDGQDLLAQKRQIDQLRQSRAEQGVESPKIYAGVEANIIGRDGTLDVPREVLSQLDIVIASKHNMKSVFPESNGKPNATELANMYMNLMDNPEVDIIGHPTREVHWSEIEKMDWPTIFSKARQTNTALEINVGTPLPRKIIKQAVQAGVPLSIGTDAHILDQFQHLSADEKATIENSDDRMEYPLGVKYSFWKRIVKILRALEEVNAPKEQIITSSAKGFEDWLSKEKIDRIKNF